MDGSIDILTVWLPLVVNIVYISGDLRYDLLVGVANSEQGWYISTLD